MALSSDLIGCKSSATKAELLLFFYFRGHILPPFSSQFISLVIGQKKTATRNPSFESRNPYPVTRNPKPAARIP